MIKTIIKILDDTGTRLFVLEILTLIAVFLSGVVLGRFIT
jgi:hypothetical protein